jgi:aryl-alcohol dehydrogenase-like predicted oxidoreductase
MSTSIVANSGTFDIGSTTTVHRLGYGAMQLTGEGVWGSPEDPDEAMPIPGTSTVAHLEDNLAAAAIDLTD